jgi:hypothetical protein
MRSVYTLEEPRELLNDLHYDLTRLFSGVRGHEAAGTAKEKVEWDKTIRKYTELLEDEFLKYEFSFFRQMRRDAERVAEIAKRNPEKAEEVNELIKQIEDMFVELGKTEFKLHFRIMFLSGMIRKSKAETLRVAKKVRGFGKKWADRKEIRKTKENKAVETERKRMDARIGKQSKLKQK